MIMKRFLSFTLSFILIFCLFGCQKEEVDLWAEEATYTEDTALGSGDKTITFEVTAQEKTVTFTIKTDRDFLGDVQFGVWYIRLRDKRRTQTPFDGVVKVEKIMMDEEIEKGIDSDVIDLISANIINERNPTCYGTDRRWANHLYPVFLTESYVKSKYISTEMFLHLF